MKRSILPSCVLALCGLASTSTSHAIVTQVNGIVLPASPGNIQTGLNAGEGAAVLSPVFDAAVSPEVFQVPKENGLFRKVQFRDMQEGAGYENTFGWYNVSDPSTLYAVLTCTPVNYEPGQMVEVDFQTEFTASRYLGGFIGFFLISPNGVSSNCGHPGNLGVDPQPFVVFTENALNGDGNYVHYLIYESKNVPLAYYFGFEDLWRGGDNDFEDMLIQVTGLQKPCAPSPEICDGADNNCDGEIDNNPVDAGQPCFPFGAPAQPDVGECQFGSLVCVSGVLQCHNPIGPAPEVCDKKDNDCNGLVDDAPTDVGESCGATEQGECAFGATQCVAGVEVCLNAKGPAPEVCDLKDNDCDGQVDDSPIDAIGNCPVPGSTCPGVRVCNNGAITCEPTTSGSDEVCNGGDDNCNGMVDEGDPGGGAECVPAGVNVDSQGKPLGTCQLGVLHCIGGTLKCVGGRGPTTEVCDGLDNDCDGVPDQLAQCPGETACVEGKCAEPCGGGEFPCPGGKVCVSGYCVSPTDGGVPGDGGKPDAAESGAGGSGGSKDASTDTSPAAGGSSPSATPEDPNAKWGMTTGGGGCSIGSSDRLATVWLALVGLLGLALRRGRRASGGRC